MCAQPSPVHLILCTLFVQSEQERAEHKALGGYQEDPTVISRIMIHPPWDILHSSIFIRLLTTNRRYREATLNSGAQLGARKYAHSRPAPFTLGNSKKGQSPTLIQELGFRASAACGGKPNYI